MALIPANSFSCINRFIKQTAKDFICFVLCLPTGVYAQRLPLPRIQQEPEGML